jgi:pimeloyl-ACP methyl ester carboxylesterase
MTETSGALTTEDGHRLAWRRVDGQGPTVVWLGGFRSDMTGTKAQHLAEWAEREGGSYLRFDYFGHGASSGDFIDGTIGRWRSDALAVIDQLTEGPLVLVGSSMGGWIACLVALARPERVRGMVLVAPAPDFTSQLIKPQMTDKDLAALGLNGVWHRPSPYGEGDPFTLKLMEDGRNWSILPGPVEIKAPVRILQGGRDEDVPWQYALHLAEVIAGDDVVFSVIKDGDHRLSRPQDLARLVQAVEELAS